MKRFLIIPAVIALLAGALLAGARGPGWDLPAGDVLLAGAAVIVASELAVVPLLFVSGSDAGTVAQAGLAGTVIQMFVSAALAGLAWAAGVVSRPQAFVLSLLAFYWIALALLVVILLVAVRSAERNRRKA